LDMEAIPFNLRDSLDHAMKTESIRAHQKGLELVVDVHPEVPDALLGDPTCLRQILLNLIGNAVKFTSQGEIVLRILLQEATEERAMLHFAVSDTGEGIPGEKHQSIFESFTQADNSMSRKFGGTGLGLTISSRLVEGMGGRVWLESETGSGSTFHFSARFTLQKDPSPVGEPGSAALANMAVLVVDDNATSRGVLSGTLHSWGMNPTVVDGGSNALDELEKAKAMGAPFPLVLLDAHMPGEDGFGIAEQIASRFVESKVVMLVSAGVPGGA
jgi:two-component system sensor histidine kinase/response regulator